MRPHSPRPAAGDDPAPTPTDPSPQPGVVTGVAAAARITGLSAGRLRALVRAGVVAPHRDARGRLTFTLAQLGLLRATGALGDVRPAQVRAALDAWRRSAGPDAVAPPRLSAPLRRGRRHVLVGDAHGEFDPRTGQTTLPLDRPGPSADVPRAAPVHHLVDGARAREEIAAADRATRAQEFHARGRRLEATDPARARDAYRRALALDPSLGAAALDLGRSLHVAGRLTEAIMMYRRLLDRCPDDAAAWFNLGVAQQDQGSWDDALASYRTALEHDPQRADAHFNAAYVCEQLGDRVGALRHLKGYRALR